MAQLAEVRLLIASKEARLILKVDDKEIEDELWKWDRKISRDVAGDIATSLFQDAYEIIQYAVHG